MIGVALKRKRDRAVFRVVGRDGSCWVLAPESHGPAISVSTLEASELFTVVGDGPQTFAVESPEVTVFGRSAAEQSAREALAAALDEELTRPPAPLPLTPDESLRAGELTAAEIVASPDYLWAYRGQRLAVSSRVAVEVDRLLAAREAA